MMRPDREVVVAGIGLHPFGRFPDKSIYDLAEAASVDALADAGLSFQDIQAVFYAQVLTTGMTPGQLTMERLGLTSVPILNVENACASGSTAIWQAYWLIRTGVYDTILVTGAEKVPRGPVSVLQPDSPERLLGTDHQMAEYALRMQRYMHDYGASVEGIAQVAVKAHANSSKNPYAQHKKEMTLAEVLESRLIVDPITLFQCCPTSEGAAAAVLMSRDAANERLKDPSRAIRIAGVSLRSGTYRSATVANPNESVLVGRDVYEMSGLQPSDVDIVQVHDAATIGEIEHLEMLGILPEGQAWKATLEGRTALTGDIPVNTDGGLQAMGHPFGASGIRMVHELVTQMRGEAGPRQVEKSCDVALAHSTGAGGVATAIMLGGA